MYNFVYILSLFAVMAYTMGSAYAKDAEIHFIGNIVEPACDALLQTEDQRCKGFSQNTMNDQLGFKTKLNTGKVDTSINSLASVEVKRLNSQAEYANMIVKYR